ncbi:MAG TPA: MotA/TolQ/ExbB proton channel family protein [Leptospiraceae bacterium]|nr:MotA/TolQ/ExbB proton channel family protein [Leptospiraceae bacterium]HMW03714.1 MotA/TolQ/ExbB proton channel family protein [Leptospiraceae bacterium]HMX31827.1 MotA/TolQ/ExbB proton channel family protein [Leptospiraceae bacterium]HNB98791.1 MotA/TolQ/ExbB proton channel family protein [Leptospiraceae bacterium]HNC54061.1 MotA/TolQ/ExbB proton channel family protein [Leptospiraceae bacterium]
MYPLAAIAIINSTLILHLLTTFFIYLRDLRQIDKKNPKSSLIKSLVDISQKPGKRKFWIQFSDKLILYERRVFWLSNLSGVATLSGLLGTVIGIYISFQNMKSSGTASAEVFADGISVALITTIAGLLIAIPSMISYYLLKHFLEVIEEESYAFLFHSKANKD